MSVLFESVRRSGWRRVSSSLVLGLATVLIVVACEGAADQVTRADKSLFDYDEIAPIELVEKNTVDRGAFLIRHVTFVSPLGGEVSAIITEPTDHPAEAGVVLMHGLPGRAGEMIEWGTALACAGVLGIAIDAPFARFGNRFREPLTFTRQDADEQIRLIVDLRRAVDVLLSEIESGPIGYLGISYGGAMGGLLAGVEDRIDAFVLAVGDGGLVAHHTDEEGQPLGPLSELSEDESSEWLEVMRPLEPALFVGDASAPILFVNGRADQLSTQADAIAYHEAAGPNHEVNWYDAGHGLTSEAWDDQMRWLADHLGIERHITDGCLPSAN
jgi:dienelactone hydrolase